MMEQQLRRSSRNNVSTNSGNVGSKSASDEPSGNQTSDDMSEDELKRKRLEQEKADRLLAEEMQREERKARIHLRERRGGSASSGSGFGSANNSQSSVSTKKSASEKEKRKRMTNNSMAACLPPVMKVDDSNSSSPVATPRRDSRSPSPEPPPPSSTTTSATTTTTTTTANNKVNKNSQSSANHSSVSKPKKKKYDEAFTKDSKKEGSKSGMSKTKVKSSIIFSQTEEDVIIGMHKVIEAMKNHSDAWPFVNPVDEDYAPNYYRVISHPMDLQTIEDKLDNLEYSSLEEFKADFQTIVDNCRKYNGPSSEYTEMVEILQDAFNKSVQRYIVPDESDEEIFSIEYNTVDRKRPRVSSPAKNAVKTPEHKKENEPRKKAPVAKSKLEKHDKKKRNQQRKQQLMRHHSRNSEAMDALSSATAETLKDINKWLGDTPKISEYSSPSPCSVSSDVVLKGDQKVEDVRSTKPKAKSIKGTKRKLVKDNRDDSSSSPKTTKNNNNKTISKEPVKTKKSKIQKETSTTDKDSVRGASSSRSNSKDKDKHHHHRHHKHRHHRPQSTTNPSREQSESPERNRSHNTQSQVHRKSRKTEESGNGSGGKTKHPSSPTRNSPHRNTTSGKSGLNHSTQQGGGSSRENHEKNETSSRVKHSETSKSTTKSPAKRGGGNSLIQGIKSSGTIKRLQGNKGTKYSNANHHHQDSKFKGAGGGSNANASVYDFVSNSSYSTSKSYLSNSEFNAGQSSTSSGNNNSGGREPTSEKKKCLLLNDCSSGKEGGPRLSLGSVLSTDAIKLGDYKKDDVFSDDEDNVQCSSSSSKGEKTKMDKFDDLKAKVQSKIKSSPDADDDSKSVKGEEVVKGEVKKDAEEEELESDRKLEPSKGFNRDKCMPNLSAWIKAFGGPAKTATPNVTSTTPTKKSDGGDPPKSKFKVLGRAQVEHSEDRSKHSSVKPGSANSTQSSSKGGKGEEPSKNQNTKTGGGDYSVSAGGDDIGGSQAYEHHQGGSFSNKRHRSRKMSTSSLSSQSESGSPSCFPANQDDQFGNRYGGGILSNPPRWVDDHWASNHSQSQSPSASSQVSSQSPAEPFSPPMSSPPRTPQTPPPWTSTAPVPVGVGFYQDLTSQHSSPEKMAETNSSNVSPSTPPSVTGNSNGSNNGSSGATSSNLNGGKNYGASYPSQQPYAPPPRYATSIPSPNIGSNLPSPSPGTNTNVDSPNRSLSMGSPHSPSVANNSGPVHPSDYSRLSLTSTSPGSHHPQPPQSQSGASSASSQPGKPSLPSQAMSPVLRPGPQLSVPYPVTSINSSGNFMMESNHPAHSHSHSPHPENAHVRHHHPSPGPPRYAHSLIPAHHHQPVTLSSQSPSLPSSSSSATIATSAYTQGHPGRQAMQGLPPTLSSSSQPQYTNSNPYTSNPRSINVAPNVYSDPIGPDSVQHRYYGPPAATPSTSSSSTKSRRSAAAAAHSSDAETSKNSPTVSSAAAAVLESAKLSSELNGFQWPHNLASLSQIVNSIPGTMTAGMGVPNAYRAHYDAAVATSSPGMENMSKFPRSEPSSYTNLTTSGGGKSSVSSGAGTAASTNQDKAHANESTTERRSSSKSESKSSRSQGSNSKNSSQPPIVPGSAFNFSALTPDLSMYSKEMSDRMTSDPSSLYSASPPSLAHHHRPDLYPTSTANFHTSFAAASAARTTAGVPAASIAPYQIPPFISHPSPYQPQSVSSQPFAHTQSPRGMVDPYQPFFQGSPHVMGLLPPSGLPHPLSIKYDEHGSKHSEDLRNGWIHPHHSLGFNRPGWI